MANALLITLVGMGLVFLAILLLWGLMALLVRLTREPVPAAEDAPVEAPAEDETPDGALMARKRRAAAAAVSVVLSLQKNIQAQTAPVTPPVSLSAWQTVQRAGQLSQRVNSARRKGNR